jgi:hypothetical protein
MKTILYFLIISVTLVNSAYSQYGAKLQHLDGLSASEKPSEFLLNDDNFTFIISMANNMFLECQPIHVILKIKNLSTVKDSIGDILEESDISLRNELTGEKLPPKIFVDYFCCLLFALRTG